MRIVFQNNSGRPDNKIFAGFVDCTTFVATNAANGNSLAMAAYGSPNWYSLDTLPLGIDVTSVSGRLYFCYDKPWVFNNPGYEPNSGNPSDPNYLLRFDKIEMTYRGMPTDVADTTSIDYFSIPIALKAWLGGTGGTQVASQTASNTTPVAASLSGITTPAGAAVVNDKSEFVRVIGPSSYGSTGSPYDDFSAYLAYLRDTYGPAHDGMIAAIKGHFVGSQQQATPQTQPQDYDFKATIDANCNITLTGNGTVVGAHTLVYSRANLAVPSGIYGANPQFSLDGGTPIYPQNDLYGWMTGDLLSGINAGAVGSMVTLSHNATPVGAMPSADWRNLPKLFDTLQPLNPYFNRYAGRLSTLSQAYNFAYTDRFNVAFPNVTVTLDPGRMDTLQVVILPDN
ncbi:MAG TPA: beta-1,3-glucanase family protein [Rhizomicrobium sp.]|nr:beta-1,3-glucanase family protein [Rhizomicrobium sp.]